MKTTAFVINQVYPLLSSINKPKYKDCKPTSKIDAEYIVINSLPINSGVMQKCYVNVNCHVKDMSDGVPDRAKIDSLANSVLTILQKVSNTNLLIDYESGELFREEALGEHYYNLKFSVKIINS